MIGAGKQAIGQLEAVCVTCKIREVRVYSRTPERAQKFCDAMGAKLGVKMYPVASAAEAVRGADIVNVITKASEPVLEGAWLEPGQHINAAGGNSFSRRELDEAAVKRCMVVVDARGTARNECGDLLPLVKAGLLDWDNAARTRRSHRRPGAGAHVATSRSRSTNRTACASRTSTPRSTSSKLRARKISASICRSEIGQACRRN